MFPSSNSCNPFLYNDQTMFGIPYISDDSPNSNQEEHPFLFLHDDYEDELLQHHLQLLMAQYLLPQQQLLTTNTTAADTVTNMVASNKATTTNNEVIESNPNFDGPSNFIPTRKQVQQKSKLTKQIPQKRDRHSKINTAQGLRDRRVRLSVEIARKFFDLQDMLGFDKASKTIEWLLTESKAEIKELKISLLQKKRSCSGGTKSVSSTSECKAVSGVDENAFKGKSLAGISKEKKLKQPRKVVFDHLARESRAKARAWARERTIAKVWRRKLENSKQYPEGSPHNLDQLKCSRTFKTAEELGLHSHDMKPSLKVVVEVEEPWSNSLPEYQRPVKHSGEEHFTIISKPSPSSIFNYQHIIATSQGPQFEEVQSYGKYC